MIERPTRAWRTVLIVLAFRSITFSAAGSIDPPTVTVTGDDITYVGGSLILTATATLPSGSPTSGKFSWSQTSGPAGALTFVPDPPESGLLVSSHAVEVASSAAGVYTVEVKYDPSPPGDPKYTVSYPVQFIEADLDALKIDHNAPNGVLADADEMAPGAFVPVNNDDDDYDSGNAADKDQAGSIAGESDLLPIILRSVDAPCPGSKYTLSIPSQVRIWQNPDRTGAVSGTTEFDANADATLYVEGTAAGTATISISWKDGLTVVDDCDKIQVTVFDWRGPLNVPGLSVHQYAASGATGSSQWGTPVNGTITSGLGTSDISVLWDSGPVVGKAVYHAHANYIWDLEVNVVQVKIKAGVSNKISYNSSPYQIVSEVICALPGYLGSALEADIVVEKIEGPTVSGGHRGGRFIEMGFVQNGQFSELHADYMGFAAPQRRLSSLEGGDVMLDHVTLYGSASTPPWYDSEDHTGTDGFFAATDSVVNNHPFNISDTPSLKATDAITHTVGGTSDTADLFAIAFDCALYFAVRTTDTRNGADLKYTQRGKATWGFDGSGSIDATGDWTQTGTGTSGDGSFFEVTNGDTVPVTTGVACNTALYYQAWSWSAIGP